MLEIYEQQLKKISLVNYSFKASAVDLVYTDNVFHSFTDVNILKLSVYLSLVLQVLIMRTDGPRVWKISWSWW